MVQSDFSVLSICFIFFALILGYFVVFFSSRSSVGRYIPPYTVTVFLCGVGLSVMTTQLVAQGSNDALLLSIDQVMRIHSDILLYTFLPVLLFGEAFTLNFYQVKKALTAATLLALPGAAFGAYLLAVFVFNQQYFKWSWRLSFAFGTILAATDPVSVVATLKDLSASSPSVLKLTYLVVGEALLNDGSALVLFEAVMSEELNTPAAITVYFIKVIFVSPLLGIALGLCCVGALRFLNRRVNREDSMMQMALTICCAYISFFLAQYVLGVSGVISCCAAGVMLAWLAPPLYLQPESLEVVWHALEWTANTLIFMLAGLIVGEFVVGATGYDYAMMLFVYFIMFLIRFAMLAVLHPALHWLSPEYKIVDSLFTGFSGLRGSLSLALVLVLKDHIEGGKNAEGGVSFPEHDVQRAMFILCGVVALTVVVNGTLAAPVYRLLYGDLLRRNAGAEAVIYHYVKKRIRLRAGEVLEQLQSDLPMHSQTTVKEMCSGIFELPLMESISTVGGDLEAWTNSDGGSRMWRFRHGTPSRTHFNGVRRSLDSEVDDALITRFRIVFLGVLRKCYLRQINCGRLPRGSSAALALLNSISVGLETVHTDGLQDWDAVKVSLENMASNERFLENITRWCAETFGERSFITPLFREQYSEMVANKVYILTSFMDAHKYAEIHIPLYLGEYEGIDTPEEALIVKESSQIVAEAQFTLSQIDQAEISRHVTRQAARMVLQSADELVLHFAEEGILSQDEVNELFDVSMADTKRMDRIYVRQQSMRTVSEHAPQTPRNYARGAYGIQDTGLIINPLSPSIHDPIGLELSTKSQVVVVDESRNEVIDDAGVRVIVTGVGGGISVDVGEVAGGYAREDDPDLEVIPEPPCEFYHMSPRKQLRFNPKIE